MWGHSSSAWTFGTDRFQRPKLICPVISNTSELQITKLILRRSRTLALVHENSLRPTEPLRLLGKKFLNWKNFQFDNKIGRYWPKATRGREKCGFFPALDRKINPNEKSNQEIHTKFHQIQILYRFQVIILSGQHSYSHHCSNLELQNLSNLNSDYQEKNQLGF